MMEVFFMLFSSISPNAVLRNLSAITVSNIFLQILGFLYRILLSRMAGAEGMGVYQLIMPLYSLLMSISLSGIAISVSRLCAERFSLGDFSACRRLRTLAIKIFSFLVLILAVVFLLFPHFFCESFLGDVRLLPTLPLLFICLFLTGIENITKSYFYGIGRVFPQITSELSEQAVRAVAVFSLLSYFPLRSAGFSSFLILCGMIISELSSVFILALFYRFIKLPKNKLSKRAPKSREIISSAAPISLSHSANNLLSALCSVIIPRGLRASGHTVLSATESFGVMFGMTLPLLNFSIAFIASLTSVMMPRLANAMARGDISDVRRKAAKTIHSTSLLAIPFLALSAALGKPLGFMFFGDFRAGELILPLAVSTLISYYEMAFGAILTSIGEQKKSAVYIILGGIILLIFCFFVSIPGVGLLAFAIGSIVSGLFTASLQFMLIVRKLSLSPRISNWFLTPLFCGALCFFVAKLMYGVFASLILSAGLSLIFYLLSLYVFGTNPVRYIKTLIREE